MAPAGARSASGSVSAAASPYYYGDYGYAGDYYDAPAYDNCGGWVWDNYRGRYVWDNQC